MRKPSGPAATRNVNHLRLGEDLLNLKDPPIRALFIAAFIITSLTPTSVYLFAAAMGFIWLSTVPLTNATIASIFGVRYLSMLSGFVFFSHQVGSFLGVWLGGYLYTLQGSYQTVWMITIALGIAAGLINLPISEAAIVREKTVTA